jgi:phenylacetate-CoA ligase
MGTTMSIEDRLHPLLAVYMASPQWVKSSIGRLYAGIPPQVRHGRAYGQFSRELAIRDPEAIRHRVDEKLLETLRWAVETVPVYREYEMAVKSAGSVGEALAALPASSKLDIKANEAGFLSSAMTESARLEMFTGGSTANPMRFYLHRGITRPKETAYIADFDARAGVRRNAVILNLRGRTVPGAEKPGGQIWMYEPIRRHLILSSDHLEPEHMPRYVDALRKWRPEFIQAFPSAVYPLARWLSENPAPDITGRIRAIQLTSENTYGFQLDMLRKVFDCPVLMHYGHSERVLMACSMPDDDRFFFWPLYGHLELLDAMGKPVTGPGVLGEITGTSFDNRVMPFVRYRTGDFGMWSDKPAHPALPGFPALERIEGRLQEFVVGADHRLISITTLGAAHFSELARASAIQYEQHEPGRLFLNVVMSVPLTDAERANIQRAVRDKTQGSCEVEVREVGNIPKTARGKHKMMVQHMDISGYLGASAND